MISRFAVLLAVTLAACGGPRVSDYAAIEKEHFHAYGSDWLVSDYAARSRLMIAPGTDDFSQGLLREYNPPPLNIPQSTYQRAVEAWLRLRHPPPCQVVEGYVLTRPQWEFTYRCGLTAPSPARNAVPQPGTLPAQH
jgi:hypothetical protein